MNLSERIEKLKTRVEKVKTAKLNFNESKLFQIRLREVTDISDSLNQVVNRLKVFQEEGIELSIVPTRIADARHHLLKVQERFIKERKAANLVKGKNWQHMQDAVDASTEDIERDLCTSWSAFCMRTYPGKDPSDVETDLAQTEPNKKTLERYKEKYKNFQLRAKSTPTSKGAFTEVRLLGCQLEEIHGGFNFDVPEAIVGFLAAVGTKNGASLDLFTDEVRGWLLDNGKISGYKIIARTEFTGFGI